VKSVAQTLCLGLIMFCIQIYLYQSQVTFFLSKVKLAEAVSL
jgi:hypothetical protein